jgi:hypothetical protein
LEQIVAGKDLGGYRGGGVRERYVLFKGEDMPEELGEDVGPVFVIHREELEEIRRGYEPPGDDEAPSRRRRSVAGRRGRR